MNPLGFARFCKLHDRWQICDLACTCHSSTDELRLPNLKPSSELVYARDRFITKAMAEHPRHCRANGRIIASENARVLLRLLGTAGIQLRKLWLQTWHDVDFQCIYPYWQMSFCLAWHMELRWLLSRNCSMSQNNDALWGRRKIACRWIYL